MKITESIYIQRDKVVSYDTIEAVLIAEFEMESTVWSEELKKQDFATSKERHRDDTLRWTWYVFITYMKIQWFWNYET